MSFRVRVKEDGKTYFFGEKQFDSASWTEVSEQEKVYLDSLSFFDFEIESLLPPLEEKAEEAVTEIFPKMLSRGKYELSNGETFEGNKEAANEAEKALEK